MRPQAKTAVEVRAEAEISPLDVVVQMTMPRPERGMMADLR